MTVKRVAQQSAPSFSAENLYQRFCHIFTSSILEEAGIRQTVLTDPDTEVALGDHCRLLELAAIRSADDCLGLHIGSEIKPGDMGPLGYTILNSPTVRKALENFSRYLHVYARGCDMTLEEEKELAYFKFSYTIVEPSVLGRRQEAECTLAMVKHVIEVATDRSWRLEEVHFEHPKPESVLEHKRIFAAPVSFGREINCLVFAKAQLDQEIVQAESRLYQVLEAHLSDVLNNQVEEDDIVATVGNIIAKSLSNGIPSIDDVAKELCMTKRTLQRRLSDRDKLYNEYADEIRQQMARQYVENTKLPLTEVAFLLGYAHVSAFSRAFRRWAGLTPNECRAQNI
ncbi:AraC family transcriptional regulator [Pseudomaricurvus alkylphenolicus]|uniref:AraC-like transcriptional regulator QhpR n=1 Tax=Pseudomaricurvus alkylphenolicus TaxID=1306991 RepID=UPI0023F9D65F|nr:AraC family transcriptional regulator [Pseudomaricurvus alkylphenolicus]NIB42262.1 AraC family transcriptional regulator [Pseudomaricurvus alkylphenolicus]